MKLVILASRASAHTARWVNALSERGHEVHLATMHPGGDALDGRVQLHALRFSAPLGYLANAVQLRSLLSRLQPELLHAHYAGGYGLLGRLSGYHPYILSVWGRDVYDVPYLSPLHRRLIVSNLKVADHLCSTSHVMAKQTRSLCGGLPEMSVTPFGIDAEHFRAEKKRDDETITIGTVKTLRSKYGIDILLQAFAAARQQLDKRAASKLRLLVVGDGEERTRLERQARDLEIEAVTTFAGKVPHAQVPEYLNQLDIYVAVSRLDSESFGVAIIEASACELPVVVSRVGGLPEVVNEGVTGLVVERENVEKTAAALLELIEDESLRKRLGKNGRQHVLKKYNWKDNVSKMEKIYEAVSMDAS